jgi:uncharacterized protein with ParB-like and HNH nuclease domain
MKLWDIHRTVYKVSDFVSWQQTGSLILSPKYQRRSVWTASKKSFLIDSIIRNLPIPIIFIRERSTDLNTMIQHREIVDGQQRLRTILAFINKTLLKDYKESRDYFTISRAHNKNFAGKIYADLDEDIKQKILDYQFSVNILPNDVDDKELLVIFSRLNSTGVQLTKQELRNAEFFGDCKSSVYQESPAQLNRWLKWGLFNEQRIARMDEVEFTSELFMFIADGISANTAASISNFYKQNDEIFPYRENIEQRFRSVFDAIDDNMGSSIKTSIFSKKSIFYTLFTAFYYMMYDATSVAQNVAHKRIHEDRVKYIIRNAAMIQDNTADQIIIDAGKRNTTHKTSRIILHKYFLGLPYDKNTETFE